MWRCSILFLLIWSCTQQPSADNINEEARIHIENEWEDTYKGETFSIVRSTKYPGKRIEELLLNMVPAFNPQRVIPFNYRNGESEFYQLCNSNIITDPVYEIIDDTGKLRYVVQSSDYFLQKIELEKCQSTGPMYTNYSDSQNFILSCEEKRIDYKFLVISEDETQLEWVSVLNGLPVSCYCRMIEISD